VVHACSMYYEVLRRVLKRCWSDRRIRKKGGMVSRHKCMGVNKEPPRDVIVITICSKKNKMQNQERNQPTNHIKGVMGGCT
jgi:hypothetical protein